MSVAGDVLLDKVVVYHILCLYVEYTVLRGYKVLLNELNWRSEKGLCEC